MTKFYPATVLAALMLSTSAIAFAAPAADFSDPPARMVVSYADLDLHRQADAQKLLARLTRAASTVCEGQREGRRELKAEQAYRACRDTALQTSVASIGSPRLNTAYAARSPDEIVLAGRR
ncbi:UrcA family protein [Phenylobacterium sp.]|jgi:UrcA family protein|uniref:UrcA family protein n=1 Tax=Phenylobacterium sp. TaxID=1871053 RepID=UPI002E334BDF|nr:UrcA family protein [Phenylobacterium sp.]HEX3363790.1 UrcA family protein [Phenylobacterium sp.]